MSLRVSLFLGDRLRENTLDWFRERNAKVEVFSCLEDCLDSARKSGTDVVVIDEESSPGGVGVGSALRKASKGVFIVFLTGPGTPPQDSVPEGADALLAFPIVQEELDRIFSAAAERLDPQMERPGAPEIRELWEISKVIASDLGTNAILDRIVESAIRVTLADSGSIMLLSQEPDTLYVAAAQGRDAVNRRNKAVHFDQSVAGWVARTGEPLLLQGGLRNDERFRHLPPARGGIRSSLCVPVKSPQRKLLGVLSLNVDDSLKYFTVKDLHLITIYASEAAAIIESSRAFDEMQSANDRLSKTNEKLKAIQAQLIESSKMAAVGLLASGIAHEFNNLLTGILGMSQLAQHTKKEKHIWKAIEVSETNSQKAKEIVKNLLKFSGRYKKVREKTEIAALVEEVLSLMGREFDKEGIVMRKHFDPEASAPVNRSEIQQVMLNLLINAKQAITGKGWVEIDVTQNRESVEISVKDSGCGIPEENMPRIFEPFFSTKSVLGGGENQGTGLGLSVSYGIIKGHGGEIRVESTVGVGSRFTLVLPKNPRRTKYYTDSLPVQDGERKRGPEVEPQPGAPVGTVLIVDDEWWIREFLKDTFEEIGYKVHTAGSGQEGLDIVEQVKPSIVFLDLVLPGCKGEDIATEMLARHPKLPIVLMTGKFESLEIIEKNLNRGIFGYLSKPFDVKDVYNLLNLGSRP